MSNQPRQTVISWSAFAGHVAVGAGIGFGVAAAVYSQLAPSDKEYAHLLRLGLYLGGVLASFLWFSRAVRESTRRETARRRRVRWNEPPQTMIASGTDGSPRPRVKTQLLTHLSYGGRTGLAYGTVEAALRITWGDGRWLVALLGITALGVAGGMLVWLVRLIDEDSRPTGVHGGDPLGVVEASQEHAASFETRLAGFLHCDVAELRQARPRPVSKMPFWSVVDFGSYIGPKPVQLIREFLERIRAAVHGPSPQNGHPRR